MRQLIYQTALFSGIFFLTSTFFVPAYSLPPEWTFSNYTLNDGAVGELSVIITVNDDSFSDNGILDMVFVNVTSNIDSSGIGLELVETNPDSGIFRNSNLIFMRGEHIMTKDAIVTITIVDPSLSMNNSTDTIDNVAVRSSSDTTGFKVTLVETGPNTGKFLGQITFGDSSNPSKRILEAQEGDIVSVKDLLTGEYTNALIVPNPDPTVGAIQADVGLGAVTATYEGESSSINLTNGTSPGRGGGGLIPPGLVFDFIVALFSGGGGCTGDCISPTLGTDQISNRLVEGGFSYNNNTIDVQLFYTPYPLVTVEVGEENVASLKIYEDQGVDNIKHVSLAFGLGDGEVISESKAVIYWEQNYQREQTVTLYDPENSLQDVRIQTETVRCSETLTAECLKLDIYHTFRQPLEFNKVGTLVWDFFLNSMQNYYNHGIEIVGDSLNPPELVKVIDRKGIPKMITLHNKTTGIDEEGDPWSFTGGLWHEDYKLERKLDLKETKHGYERYHDEFENYRHNQTNIAKSKFEDIVGSKLIIGYSYDEITKYTDPVIGRSDDPILKNSLEQEKQKAEELFTKLFKVKKNF